MADLMKPPKPELQLWMSSLSDRLEGMSDEAVAKELELAGCENPRRRVLIEFPENGMLASLILRRDLSNNPVFEIAIFNPNQEQVIPSLNNVFWQDAPVGPDTLPIGLVESGAIASVLQRLANYEPLTAMVETERRNTALIEQKQRGFGPGGDC